MWNGIDLLFLERKSKQKGLRPTSFKLASEGVVVGQTATATEVKLILEGF